MGKKHGNPAARIALGLHLRLKEAREAAGVSRETMAGWLGVHVTNYARIEGGTVTVASERAVQLARLLNVSVAWLLGEATERKAG